MADGRKPDWVVRAKQDPSSEYWFSIGVGWTWQNGKDGVALRLHTVPVNWNGEMILVRPLDAEQDAPVQEAPKKGKK
jgi:hypothetical protein